MCTPCLSEWSVLPPDWPDLGMFSGEWWILGGWNAIRVPSRVRVFPAQSPFWGSECGQVVHR